MQRAGYSGGKTIFVPRISIFSFFFFPLSSLPPTIQRDRLSAAAASGVGHVGRVALIDAQKIRLTHLAATSRIPMRNITLTNDFRRCVKRSHCSAAEVGRWAGNAPLGRSHSRCREWQSVFVNTNYHAPAPSSPPAGYYIELLENSLGKWICRIFIALHRCPRIERGQSTGE